MSRIAALLKRAFEHRHSHWQSYRDNVPPYEVLMWRWNGSEWESREPTAKELDDLEWWQAIK